MRKDWWKALCVLILLYTIVVGLIVPLKPGIEETLPVSVDAGELLVLSVKGYNTDFVNAQDQRRAWLKLDDTHAVAANQLLTVDERRVRISFSIPASLPGNSTGQPASLIIDDPFHGPMVKPDAVMINNAAAGGSASLWTTSPVSDLHVRGAFRYPFRPILYETIRTIYYHVPMWFAMIFMLFASGWHSIRYMRFGQTVNDRWASALATTGTIFGVLGLLTGMLWAKYTWGTAWSWDIKQNVSAITLLIYFAYFILRKSFDDPERRARTAAVYNVFAAAMLIPLLFVIPRLTDSLHPGSGGNPALGGEDLDNTMRAVFYPAVIGWILAGLWLSQVLYRIRKLEHEVAN
ncbi:MAG: cytochrome c biogenesis protein CcsA [Saprospiraceae bacterium]|nr:cytochrome c biogenesis protein CcsA [Saprospiraceae bacterium]